MLSLVCLAAFRQLHTGYSKRETGRTGQTTTQDWTASLDAATHAHGAIDGPRSARDREIAR